MKILLANNYYYNRGGDCTYLFSLKDLLEERGHKVSIFSMQHPKNFGSDYSKYFVSYINYDEEVKNVNMYSAFKVLNRTIYSKESKVKIEELIKEERPDIVHLQNIHHHITPSIFYPLKKQNIPIVWTLHDYTLICPNTSFLSHGKVCERCKKRKYFWPLLSKCKKNSFSASFMAAVEILMHRTMKVKDLVDIFIAPSEFLRNKFIEYGFNEKKIVCLNNFSDISVSNESEDIGDYYLYVGRLSEEKGLRTLIDATLMTKTGKLKVLGDGPVKEEMISYVKKKNGINMIEFLGHRSHDEVTRRIKKSRFVVIPSEWYENFPYSILETFSCGKPAIGSKIGGIPELIRDTERGIIFETGDAHDLSSTIKYLLNNPDIVEEMGKSARDFITKELTAEKHYQKLIKIYEQAISERFLHTS